MGALRTTGMSTLDRVSSRPLPVHEFATEQETRPTQTDRKRSALAKRKLCDTNTSARESDGRPASDEVMDTHSRALSRPPREPWGAPARDGTSHINGTRARALSSRHSRYTSDFVTHASESALCALSRFQAFNCREMYGGVRALASVALSVYTSLHTRGGPAPLGQSAIHLTTVD